MVYLSMQDLVANAFITLLDVKKLNKQRFISYADIDRYAHSVLDVLESSGIKARLDLGIDEIEKFLYYNSEYFTEMYSGNILGLQLNQNVTVDDLFSRYASSLSVNVLRAFRSDIVIQYLIK